MRVLAVVVASVLAACATAASRSERLRQVDDRPLGAPGGEPSAALVPSSEAGPDELSRRMASAHRALGRGRPAATVLVRGRLGAGQEQGFTIELGAGTCHTLLAVGGDEATDIDLVLLDSEGAAVAEDLRRSSRASVEVCPVRAGRYRAVVRAYRSGAYAFQVFGG